MIGLGGVANGYVRQTGFDITAASEVMAIVAVARDLRDLRPAQRSAACSPRLLGVAAGAIVVATEVAGGAWNPSVVAAALAVLGGLLLQDRRRPRPQ